MQPSPPAPPRPPHPPANPSSGWVASALETSWQHDLNRLIHQQRTTPAPPARPMWQRGDILPTAPRRQDVEAAAILSPRGQLAQPLYMREQGTFRGHEQTFGGRRLDGELDDTPAWLQASRERSGREWMSQQHRGEESPQHSLRRSPKKKKQYSPKSPRLPRVAGLPTPGRGREEND
jgi:hypothetical protein